VFNFDYNNTKISDTNEAFLQFMHKVKKSVEAYKGIEVSIIASASKVPTSTFKNNEELAKKRLEDAKKVFMDNCKKLGISVEKYSIAEEKFLVQGPSYENDPENTGKYLPYQFVKFIVKF
jgi:phosphopantetheine adenylyltransferase